MSKTSTDLVRHALNGPTMGSRWSALFFAPATFDPGPVRAALQAAVDRVDGQMSTWRPESDLMRLNAAPVGAWCDLPEDLARVLHLGLAIGRASGGAFDIATGDAVAAWGFGPAEAAPGAIRAATEAPRRPAWDCLDLDRTRLRKRAAVTLDLNGIAKGYGVDRLAEVLAGFGIGSALVGIDGEMRALGARPDGAPWAIAVEAPDPDRRAPHSVLSLEDAAVATSGDYRHWVTVGGRRLSHTMNPATGAPLGTPPASVTVVAPTCAEADAWATALMVLGPEYGADCARRTGLDALILVRGDGAGLRPCKVGRLFSAAA
ncbi:FAD:protein FMN transferase [Albidovulum sp.]|uniref:FAD:protein FMN transferase n=1 Tax=Albidovulum sp. TaxID=1872424 RepID=UPI0039B83398